MKSLIVASVAIGMMSSVVHAECFLEKLVSSTNVVSSSPYATGGDVIMRIGDETYVHVFTNVIGVATFRPSRNLAARAIATADEMFSWRDSVDGHDRGR